ncbi:hypothetical protein ZIOFF_061710 [Zingiber officinale]|uniref:Uncharacterized protein n=1 Tax=Zingiber officinale TaxID=94328 RepID=A0A8J5F0J1_ZINOF|nr:hypothetical protein ZIOFF_061710 [Zingiber officinale]
MAFHGRIPLELSYTVNHLGDDPAAIGSMDSLSGTAEHALAAKSFALAGEGANSSWLHDGGFLHLQSPSEPSPSPREGRFVGGVGGQWLPSFPLVQGRDGGDAGDLHAAEEPEASGGGEEGEAMWKSARHKSEILAHPLYEQLLSAHIACLRVATPVDQLPRIDAQLAQTRHVFGKYSALGAQMLADDKELDQFMAQYVLLLRSFKDQLQQHVRVDAMEAVMACWELEQSLQSLTGVSPGEGTGATMSDDDDEEDQEDNEPTLFGRFMDGSENMGFGPLVPTESERSLMERVRQELKLELKQVQRCNVYFLLCMDPNGMEPHGSEGVQGEAGRCQRGNSPKKKSWEAPRRYHFYLEGLVAVPLPVAIPNGGRQSTAGARNGAAAKANQQLVHQPKEKELAQQSTTIVVLI